MFKPVATMLGLVMLIATPVLAQASTDANKRAVQQLLSAFNQHDIQTIGRLLSDDVQWLAIEGEGVKPRVTDKEAMLEVVNTFFTECPSCRTELLSIQASKQRVTTIEKASWEKAGKPEQQQSVTVYEFSDGLISRVYYYPAE